MSSGYVLTFSDRTFEEFVLEAINLDIHAAKYSTDGSSKARKLRVLWRVEPDGVVGTLLHALLEHALDADASPERTAAAQKCRRIAVRLLAAGPALTPLKEHANRFDAAYLTDQIRRMENAVNADPSLAIGTAKELLETCCKTILAERGKPVVGSPDIPTLTRATFKELKLVAEDVPDSARGADVIRRLLSNLATVGQGLAELRGLYGTGHGKHARAGGLQPRHAKLAVGAAATLAVFMLETHQAGKSDGNSP